MKDPWKPKPGDRVVRHPRQEQINPIHVTISTRKINSRASASPLILIYALASLIAVGTIALLLPFSHHGQGFTPFFDALFTATSASTVTGLVIQDTATYWTKTGQIIIMSLMFIGGLGFMTTAIFLLVMIGQRVSLPQRLLIKENLGVHQIGGLVNLTVKIVLVVLILQLIGFVALFARFYFIYPLPDSIWHAMFHSISSFNNAGFVIFPASSSLSAFQTDKIVLGITGILIITGSIGYWTLLDIGRLKRFALFSLNTKLVLISTIILILLGSLGFLISEYTNDTTIGNLNLLDKISVSLFESVSGRTAGFSTVDFGQTQKHTNFFISALMFIGGASASVSGGIKINTIAIVILAVFATIQNKKHSTAFGREISQNQVERAMTIILIAIAFIFIATLLLTLSERNLLALPGNEITFIDLFFEIISAIGTVGLSTGLTSEISTLGQSILMFCIFIGKIGPLTLALAMIQGSNTPIYRFAQERVTIG